MQRHLGCLMGLLLIFSQGCNRNEIVGSGSVIINDRPAGEFTRIELSSGNGVLTLSQGSNETISIEAEENLISQFTTEINDGRLIIKSKDGVRIIPTKPINFNVTMKKIDEIVLSGSGDLFGQGNLNVDDLSIQLSGSGNIVLGLNGKDLAINMMGSGNANLHGLIEKQKVVISGSGEYKADELISKEAKININGSGDARVHAENRLNISIYGSGSVEYAGHPELQQNVVGSGKIEPLH